MRGLLRWVCCSLIASLVATGAAAQSDNATAEVLLRKSGLWKQLDGIAPQMRASMTTALSQTASKSSDAEVQRLTQAVDAAYAASRLQAVALGTVAQGIDARHVRALTRWFDTPVGKQITALEEVAAADTSDPQAVFREGSAIFESWPSPRRALLNEIAETTRVAEIMAGLTISTALATHQGARSVRPELPGPSGAELKAGLDAQRPQMLQAYTAFSIAIFAKTYATVSTDDLRQYSEFLKSDAGRHFHELCARALEAAMVDASTEFGRRLPGARDGATS